VWLGAVNQEILANAREVGVKQPLTTTYVYVQCTNRSLLRWLKLWEHAVFGTELKPAVKNQNQVNEAKTKKLESFFANKKPAESTVNELLDDTNRPVQKVGINAVDLSTQNVLLIPLYAKRVVFVYYCGV